MPQCAVIGWPGHSGQASPAALSQTVKTKSSCGAPGAANSAQDFERSADDVVVELAQQIERARIDLSFGLAAGVKARNFPRPARLRIASAMIERAELPVQRKRTL